jgi:hypothetical protein
MDVRPFQKGDRVRILRSGCGQPPRLNGQESVVTGTGNRVVYVADTNPKDPDPWTYLLSEVELLPTRDGDALDRISMLLDREEGFDGGGELMRLVGTILAETGR